jgi:hypothetical protein
MSLPLLAIFRAQNTQLPATWRLHLRTYAPGHSTQGHTGQKARCSFQQIYVNDTGLKRINQVRHIRRKPCLGVYEPVLDGKTISQEMSSKYASMKKVKRLPQDGGWIMVGFDGKVTFGSRRTCFGLFNCHLAQNLTITYFPNTFLKTGTALLEHRVLHYLMNSVEEE